MIALVVLGGLAVSVLVCAAICALAMNDPRPRVHRITEVHNENVDPQYM